MCAHRNDLWIGVASKVMTFSISLDTRNVRVQFVVAGLARAHAGGRRD